MYMENKDPNLPCLLGLVNVCQFNQRSTCHPTTKMNVTVIIIYFKYSNNCMKINMATKLTQYLTKPMR